MSTHRFAAVLNKKIETGKIMNALAHMTVGLVGMYPQISEMGVIDYADKDGGLHSASKHPYIILKADNSNKLRTLRAEALEKGVACTSFTSAMTEGSWEDQVARQKEIPELELDYFGVALFGPHESVAELTRKFSLWQ